MGWLKEFYLRLRYGYEKRPTRLKLHGLVTVAPARYRNDEEKFVRAAIIDISSSGTAIECFSEFKVGDDIVLQFTLPTHRVALSGEIMRRKSVPPTWIYGVRFIVYEADKHALKQVLAFAREEMRKLKKAQSRNPSTAS